MLTLTALVCSCVGLKIQIGITWYYFSWHFWLYVSDLYFGEQKDKGFTQKGRLISFKVPAQQRSTWPTLNVIMAAQLSSDKNKLAALAKIHPRTQISWSFSLIHQKTSLLVYPLILYTGSIKCDRKNSKMCWSVFQKASPLGCFHPHIKMLIQGPSTKLPLEKVLKFKNQNIDFIPL